MQPCPKLVPPSIRTPLSFIGRFDEMTECGHSRMSHAQCPLSCCANHHRLNTRWGFVTAFVFSCILSAL